jgi:hypothetical protein
VADGAFDSESLGLFHEVNVNCGPVSTELTAVGKKWSGIIFGFRGNRVTLNHKLPFETK